MDRIVPTYCRQWKNYYRSHFNDEVSKSKGIFNDRKVTVIAIRLTALAFSAPHTCAPGVRNMKYWAQGIQTEVVKDIVLYLPSVIDVTDGMNKKEQRQ